MLHLILYLSAGDIDRRRRHGSSVCQAPLPEDVAPERAHALPFYDLLPLLQHRRLRQDSSDLLEHSADVSREIRECKGEARGKKSFCYHKQTSVLDSNVVREQKLQTLRRAKKRHLTPGGNIQFTGSCYRTRFLFFKS